MAEIIIVRSKIGRIQQRYVNYDANRVHYAYLDRNNEKAVLAYTTLLGFKKWLGRYGERYTKRSALYRKVCAECDNVIVSLSQIIDILQERIFYEDSDDGDQFYEEDDPQYL